MYGIQDAYDVVVAEGGFAGAAAALALRRLGFSVLLLEPRTALGWEVTRALESDWREPDSPVGKDFAERAANMGGVANGRLDAPVAEFAWDALLADEGVDFLLMARAVGLVAEGGLAKGVRVASKSGESVVGARAVVDATRCAALWHATGGEVSPPKAQRAAFTVMLNGLAEDATPENAETVLDGIAARIMPSVWPGEATVRFEFDDQDISRIRVALPGLLASLRRERPAFQPALVTFMSQETYPLTQPAVQTDEGRHPSLRNVFALGPWAPGAAADARAADLMELGEALAPKVAEALEGLPEAKPLAAEATVAPAPSHEADVVVVGGGTAGALAAIAAARGGAKTVLLEQGTCLGGIGTVGGIHSYYHGVEGGLQDEVDDNVDAASPAFMANQYENKRTFHPEAKQVVLEQMALDAGVEIVYGAVLLRVETEHAATSLPATPTARPKVIVRGVAAATPQGLESWRCRVVIDSSGDGDAAALAGAEFTFGREGDGLPHAYSQSAGAWYEERKMVFGLNFDAGFCDPGDVVDMTRARRRGLELLRRERFTPENRYYYIAPLLGLRNARLVVGDYRLTLADQIEGREFPDVVAYAYSHYDNHAPDYENESDAGMFWVWALSQWQRRFGCEIPYRCLLPRGVEGMLVACRALSLTQDAHHQMRMERDMQRIGEAAGVAAALAVKENVPPRNVDIARLQAELVASGALGKPEKKALPAPEQVATVLHENAWKPAPPPALPPEELVNRLDGPDAPEAVWRLARQGPEAVGPLVEAAKSNSPARRYNAALALAALRRSEAVPELLDCLRERRAEVAEARMAVPKWHTAVCLLGRVRAREAVPELLGVLADDKTPVSITIGALRSLERIADPVAAEAVEAFIARDDLPETRPLKISTAAAKPAIEKCRWQIDLAAARALLAMGRLRPDLAEKHLDDERALVRAQAQRVLDAIRSETDFAGGKA